MAEGFRLALSRVAENLLFGAAEPTVGEGEDDLVQDDDGEFGELGTALAAVVEHVAGDGEKALELRLRVHWSLQEFTPRHWTEILCGSLCE